MKKGWMVMSSNSSKLLFVFLFLFASQFVVKNAMASQLTYDIFAGYDSPVLCLGSLDIHNPEGTLDSFGDHLSFDFSYEMVLDEVVYSGEGWFNYCIWGSQNVIVGNAVSFDHWGGQDSCFGEYMDYDTFIMPGFMKSFYDLPVWEFRMFDNFNGDPGLCLVQSTPVPEPSTMLFFVIGIFILSITIKSKDLMI